MNFGVFPPAPLVFHKPVKCSLGTLVFQGEAGKMSASDPNFALYVTDSGNDIKNKVVLFSLNQVFLKCRKCLSYTTHSNCI
ncbi:tryptophan--tRNA ligase, cytoplasmic, partial [Olea europaea subsp. europaea]